MVNLLPISEKIKIQKMYKSHLLIVALSFFVVIIGFGAITLLPALFWSFVKENTAEERLAIVSQIVSTEERKNIRESVAGVNQKTALLQGAGEEATAVYEAIEKITERKISGISVIAFFYENAPGSAQRKRMTISGVSKNRQTLVSFVDGLEKENIFADVELPVSNFVRNADIPFSVSLSFKSKNNGDAE